MFPDLWEEVRRMSRKKGQGQVLSWKPVIEHVGLPELIKQIGIEHIIDEVGMDRLIDEVGMERVADVMIAKKGLKWWLERLTPAQRAELKRHL